MNELPLINRLSTPFSCQQTTRDLKNQLSPFLAKVIKEELLECILKGPVKLSLEGLPVTNDDLKIILSYCPSLKWCDLSECTLLTDEGLKCIPLNIESLFLRGLPQLKGESLDYLVSSCPSLQTLDLSQTEINFSHLPKLANLPHLKVLLLWQCRKLEDSHLEWLKGKKFKHLDISYCTSLTDACTSALLGAKKIDLDGSNYLTDKGIKTLSHSGRLKEISLIRCKLITSAGISLFKKEVVVEQRHNGNTQPMR